MYAFFSLVSYSFLCDVGFVAVVIIDALSASRSKLKSDGVNVSQWLQGLATYTGAFYRRFPNVELQGLLLYLANRIKDSESLDLLVLRV